MFVVFVLGEAQQALRKLDKERMDEYEDPDRFFAGELEEKDAKRKGKGKGKGKGKKKGGKGAKGKGKGAKGKHSPANPQEQKSSSSEVPADVRVQGAGEDAEVPGEEVVESPTKRLKRVASPKAKGTKRLALLKRANSRMAKTTPKKKRKVEILVSYMRFIYVLFCVFCYLAF